MKLTSWLKANGEAIKAMTSVAQSLAVIGGIAAGVHAFILGPKVEERERVRNTMPFLEKAAAAEFQDARARFAEMQLVFMGASMAGPDRSGDPDYRSVRDLAILEGKAGQTLVRLAGFYETVERCIAGDICSERFIRHSLCRDATQLYDDVSHLKKVLESRYTLEKFEKMDPFAQDRKRMYASLGGFEIFSAGCRRWNDKHPQDSVSVSDGPRRAPL